MKSFKNWLEHRVHKKVNWHQTIYKGTRQIDKEDLSKDYPGHLSNMGTVYPFKVLGKNNEKLGGISSTLRVKSEWRS